SFVATDTTTQGNWKGVYGSAGYDIAQDTSSNNPSLPAGTTVNVNGASNYTWTANGNEQRDLLPAANSNSRIAAVWYSFTSFAINLSFSDNQPHVVALYAMDWDVGTRNERFDVIDTGSGTVLDSRTLSGFGGGTYLVWNVTGNVTI